MKLGVFLLALSLVAFAATLALGMRLLSEMQGSRTAPLATVIDKARPVERTVYAESTPFVQATGSERRFLGLLQSQRLLVATGQCTAGVDFTQHPPEFVVNGGNLTIRLIEPRLFGCGIVEQRFYDGTGLIPASDALSNELSGQVTEMLRDAALRSGILATARENAATRLELRVRQVAGAVGAEVTGVSVEFVKP